MNSLDAGSGLILGVGLDRFLCLRFPIWYKRLDRTRYLAVILASSAAFGASVAAAALAQTQEHTVHCTPPTALEGSFIPSPSRLGVEGGGGLGGPAFMYWIGANLVINITVVIVYILAFRRAKELRDAEVPMSNRQQRKEELGVQVLGSDGRGPSRKTEQRHAIMLSLVLVVHVYMASWLATMAILALSSIAPLHPNTRLHIQAPPSLSLLLGSLSVDSICQAYCGWLVLVNVGSNVWIYAWRSELYRREMGACLRACLPWRPVSPSHSTGPPAPPRSRLTAPLVEPRPRLPSYGLLLPVASPVTQPLPTLSVTYAEADRSYVSSLSSPN